MSRAPSVAALMSEALEASRSVSATKTASVVDASYKELAVRLRAYEPRPLSFEDLHGVKIAEVGPEPSPLGHAHADGLRQLAHGLRKLAHEETVARAEAVRDVHSATRALMLLRRT